MEISRRHAMRKSDFKELKEKLKEVLGEGVDLLFKKGAELIIADIGEFYAENKKILAFKIGDKIIPSLRVLNDGVVTLPAVTVDMGAIPYVTNGADIMAPGITKITDDLTAGTIIMIIDETHGKALAVGELLFSGSEIKTMKKGKAVKNIHYVNDIIWNIEL